jgi:hypothetical protein
VAPMRPAHPSASLRSENDEISAVEMTRRGKRGKLKRRVSPSFRRAWKSGPERRIPTFPPRQRRAYIHKKGEKNEAKTKFQLTLHGHFPHYYFPSVASLRSRLFRRRKRLSRSHRNHLSPSSEFPHSTDTRGSPCEVPASRHAHLARNRLRCTMQFQRTANSVLTVCLSPGDNPTSGFACLARPSGCTYP